jgi:hypothetical protein
MKMDETWSVFQFAHDREGFEKQFIPEIYLKPNVHPDVVENFRVIKRLIEHSFFEYKFYDVATLKSLLTLEMALRIRYKQVNHVEWPKRGSLARLLDWFSAANYFDVYNKEYLTIIREIRNSLAHPTQHSVSGASGRRIIENAIDLINGLYEDPRLRRKRMGLTVNIINKLQEFKNGIRCTIGNKMYHAFNSWPAFINNKLTPIEIHFYFNPTFHIPEETLLNTNLIYPPVEHFAGNTIRILKNSIELRNSNSDTLIISAISDELEQQEYLDWVNRYEPYCKPGYGYIYPNGSIIETYTMHLRQFHKMN